MPLEASRRKALVAFSMSGGERSKQRRVQEELSMTKSRDMISSSLEGCESVHQTSEVGGGLAAKSRRRGTLVLGMWSYNLIPSESDRIESRSTFSSRAWDALTPLEASRRKAPAAFSMSGGERSKQRRVLPSDDAYGRGSLIVRCVHGYVMLQLC